MSILLLRRRYYLVLDFFIIGLILSGLTAFPLLHELRLMAATLGIEDHAAYQQHEGLKHWIGYVWHGLEVTQRCTLHTNAPKCLHAASHCLQVPHPFFSLPVCTRKV